MTAFVIAAIAMLVALVPAGVVMARGASGTHGTRGTLADAVIGYEFISTVIVEVLALIAEGLARSGLFELPVLLAILLYGSGLVFARSLERWL
jgi:multisubunit Na+/H+ antiporter MnhF subunit